jgi:hypothetical protein
MPGTTNGDSGDRFDDAMMADLSEQHIQAGAQLAEEILAASDAGEIDLSAEGRQLLVEILEIAIDHD